MLLRLPSALLALQVAVGNTIACTHDPASLSNTEQHIHLRQLPSLTEFLIGDLRSATALLSSTQRRRPEILRIHTEGQLPSLANDR